MLNWPADLDDFMWTLRPDGPITRVLLFLHGRNMTERSITPHLWEQRLADAGVLVAHPYFGPWGWLTPSLSDWLDDLLSTVLSDCPAKVPITLAGGSMGGHAALQHLIGSRHHFDRCHVSCPVTDLKTCYEQLPEVRKSIALGLLNEPGTPSDRLRHNSPIHRVTDLPRAPLQIFFNADDHLVPMADHGLPYRLALQQHQIAHEWHVLPNGHCKVIPESEFDLLRHDFLVGGGFFPDTTV